MDKWDQRFMDMAFTIAGWSSCFRAGRSIGCVIVKDKRIMTTGYNGAPAGIKTCREKGECLRDKLGIPSGTRMETCYAVHAEQNAIVQDCSGGEAGRVHRRGDPVLHPPAVLDVLQDDHQQRHQPRGVQGRISGRVYAGVVCRGGREG